MRADQRKFHIIYKTTCLITGKFYIGMHSTDNIYDGYLGSGKILGRSVAKYGKDKHRYEVMEYLSNRKALSLREEELLTTDIRRDPMCMNIRSGGTGNQPGKALTEETKAKMSVSLKKMWDELKASGYKKPKQSAEQIANRAAKNTGQTRTEETKQRMREAQAKYVTTVTPEKRALEYENRASAKSKTWKVLDSAGNIKVVTNLKKFSMDNGISGTKLYNTRCVDKFVCGFKLMGPA